VCVCSRVWPCMLVRVHVFACAMCVPVYAFGVYVRVAVSTGSHLLPDGTNMFLATCKDGETKIHEVSADIEFVGLQVAC